MKDGDGGGAVQTAFRTRGDLLRVAAAALGFGVLSAAPAAIGAGSSSMLLRTLDPSGHVDVIVHVDVMPKAANDAKDALESYVIDTRKEGGALRVEAVQEVFPNHFDLVEEWQDEAAYLTHVSSKASLNFRRAVAPWLASPWNERIGQSIAPAR